MRTVKSLRVIYHGRTVGTLAATREGKVAFQYDEQWILNGFSISPFSLPLASNVYVPVKDNFEGLFGVFADSLPDGWGRLLVDRMLRKNGISSDQITPLERLGIVGSTGMGALEYVPELLSIADGQNMSFDEMSEQCRQIMSNKDVEDLDQLVKLGGSSGGARPKALVSIDKEDWIIKFPLSMDPQDIGEEEFDYMKCAAKCGIDVPEVRLFTSELCGGYFGVRRFDRGICKTHMVSVGAMLETSHRYPNLDYNDIIKLTYILTRDDRQVEEIFRRMCFNVFAHNRDDHSKNFSFLYVEDQSEWRLSPAYDLTYSQSIGGEHATSVNGNGRDPGMKEIMEVTAKCGLSASWAKQVAESIDETVSCDLRKYLHER
ncbi:MAG: type II toxin-antitoxin system HipA family toxin [Clostridiales bacterium]|nr:type II toxin-antitoxin system HipA family toxin [Clostridiales bacterium]